MADETPERKRAFEAFKQHLESIGVRIPACPICGSFDWTFSNDLFQVSRYDEGQPGMPTVETGLPIAALYCGKCFYFLPFFWGPIRLKVDGRL